MPSLYSLFLIHRIFNSLVIIIVNILGEGDPVFEIDGLLVKKGVH